MASQDSIGVGMIGCGTVGTGVAQLLQQQASIRNLEPPMSLRRVLVRDLNKPRRFQPNLADEQVSHDHIID